MTSNIQGVLSVLREGGMLGGCHLCTLCAGLQAALRTRGGTC